MVQIGGQYKVVFCITIKIMLTHVSFKNTQCFLSKLIFLRAITNVRPILVYKLKRIWPLKRLIKCGYLSLKGGENDCPFPTVWLICLLGLSINSKEESAINLYYRVTRL